MRQKRWTASSGGAFRPGQAHMNGSIDDRPTQLPLGFGLDAGHDADDLVVTGANEAAARLIGAWPAWPSPVVVLTGPPGSGKSHLAAIWRSRSGATVLDAAAIGVPVLARGQAVLVEDADRAGIDEAGLFHLVNAVLAGGGTLLVTARTAPAAWGLRLADLASRLRAATLVEIAAPDDALLAAVIVKLFADRQVAVEPQVVRYLVHRMDRSLAAAMRLVGRIDALSLERKSRITRALAAEALEAAGPERAGADT
jgi:chromosomal replication initiation ATPase DnaA